MCTLVAFANVVPSYSLVIVANRDEQLDRPSTPPHTWPEGFFAPRDELAGGTWLGLNASGVFVGITNRFLGPRDASRRSRGELVVRALRLPSARAIHDAMRATAPAAYNGFHLFYADARDVLATVSDGHTLAQLTLGRGINVITERSFGAGDERRRIARIGAAWKRIGNDPNRDLSLEAFTTLLTEHDADDPLAATCVHAPALNYGTRSAMVLGLRAAPSATPASMLWADGPPCTTPFLPVAVSTKTG